MHPVDAHIVIGVPDSGLDAALGYSHASGIPCGIGLIKNKYIGRTFIAPGQDQRLDQVNISMMHKNWARCQISSALFCGNMKSY